MFKIFSATRQSMVNIVSNLMFSRIAEGKFQSRVQTKM